MDGSSYARAGGSLGSLAQFKVSASGIIYLCFLLLLLFFFQGLGYAQATNILRDTDMGMSKIMTPESASDIIGTWNAIVTINRSTCSGQPVGQMNQSTIDIEQNGSDILISDRKISWGRPDKRGKPMTGTIAGALVEAGFIEPPKESDSECPACKWAISFSATLSDDGNSLGGVLQKNGSGGECSWSADFSAVRVKNMVPKMVVSPKSVNFSSIKMGTSTSRDLTISNKGSAPLTVSNISVVGTNVSEFSQTNICSDTIPPGSSCKATVTFTPLAGFGAKVASMTISSDDPRKSTVNVKLSGRAAPPKIVVAPTTINFGPVAVDTVSNPKTVTIKNMGISDLTVNAVTVTGVNASEFAQSNNCLTIAQGNSCAITVTLSTTSPGNKSAFMSISSNDPKKSVINVRLGANSGGGSVPPTVNISGIWHLYLTIDGVPGEQDEGLETFTQLGKSVSGTTATGMSMKGGINGLDITLSWDSGDGEILTATGTVNADGTEMSGTYTDEDGEFSGKWRAIKIS